MSAASTSRPSVGLRASGRLPRSGAAAAVRSVTKPAASHTDRTQPSPATNSRRQSASVELRSTHETVRSTSSLLSQNKIRTSLLSQNNSLIAAPSRVKTLGDCSVCRRQLSLTAYGLVHRHGTLGINCAGSGCVPAVGSISSSHSTTDNGATSVTSSQPADISQPAHVLLDTIVEARVSVVKYIPKASRLLAAAKLTTIIDRIVTNSNNIDAWKQLLLFTFSCFGTTQRGGKRHRSSLATKVNKALSEYLSVGHQPQPTPSSKERKNAMNDLNKLAARVSAKIEEGDVRGAVRLAVSNDTLAPYGDATAAALRQLHPPRATPTASFPPSPSDGVGSSFAALTLTDSDIAAAIKSFPAGSAGGLDGMRPQPLKDMTSTYSPAS